MLGHTQAEVRKGGGVTRGKGGVVENGTPLTIRGCKHDRKGFCFTHEMVATKKYREIPCLKAGPDGQKVKTTKKKHYFECEVGPSGRGVLRQTVLKFSSVSPSITTLSGGGQDGVGGGMDNSIDNFSLPTVGQYRGAARPVGLERQMDQNVLD